MNITENLKTHFESQPNLEQVWLNEAGEWCHFDHPAYPECATRKEVFGSKIKEDKKSKPAKEAE